MQSLLMFLLIFLLLAVPAMAGLGDATLVRTFTVPDNGERHSQDALTWDGANLWAVSHTDDQHHYLSLLTDTGALVRQFPVNVVFYSGMVTSLAFDPAVGPLAKIRKRIYRLGSNGIPCAEYGSSLSHHAVAYRAEDQTLISVIPRTDGKVELVFTDAAGRARPEWGGRSWYYNPATALNLGQPAQMIGDVEYHAGYLYLADGLVYQIEVNNPAAPALVETLSLKPGEQPAGVAFAGELLFVGVRNHNSGALNTVQVFDLAPARHENNGVRDHGQGEGRDGVGQGKGNGRQAGKPVEGQAQSWGAIKQVPTP